MSETPTCPVQASTTCLDHGAAMQRLAQLERRASEDRQEMREFRREVLAGLEAVRVQGAILVQSVQGLQGLHGQSTQESPGARRWLVDLFGPFVISAGRALVYASILIPIGLVVLSHPQVAAQAGEMVRAIGGIR